MHACSTYVLTKIKYVTYNEWYVIHLRYTLFYDASLKMLIMKAGLLCNIFLFFNNLIKATPTPTSVGLYGMYMYVVFNVRYLCAYNSKSSVAIHVLTKVTGLPFTAYFVHSLQSISLTSRNRYNYFYSRVSIFECTLV